METSEELKIIEDYEKNRISIHRLTEKYHHSQRVIIAILDNYNISHERGKLAKGRKRGPLRILTKEEEEAICQIYRNGGTVHDCCVVAHCNQNLVRNVLKENGLYKNHAQTMAELPQNQIKYPIDEKFFMTQSHNLAYLLGFWASDGYVSYKTNDMALCLQSEDKGILEKMHDEIGGRPLYEYVSKEGHKNIKWSFCSRIIKEELETYGIIPRKTFILKPPLKLKREYWIDYIRGYFDGDGSINYLQNGTALRWQICSASPEILQWIIDFLYEEYGIKKVTILKDPGGEGRIRLHDLYYFQYSTNATKQIHKILYTPNSWYLQRKKDFFDKCIKLKK